MLVGIWLRGVWSLGEQNHPEVAAANFSVHQSIRSGVYMITTGGMLALSALAIVWQLRDLGIRWQPGMWLALFGFADFLLIVGCNYYWRAYWPLPDDEIPAILVFELIYRLLWTIALSSLAARCPFRNWQIVFGVFSLSQLIGVIGAMTLLYEALNGASVAFEAWIWDTLLAIPSFDMAIRLAVLATAAVADLIRCNNWAWAHWAGVSFWFAERAILTWW